MRLLFLVLAIIPIMLNASMTAIAMEQPVVLELFTSQGCSSCPPADALLKQLSADDPSLLALSFHVHYWDYLGWKDPFSSAVNTERQKIYAQSIGEGQVFTPQLIVNGQISAVGSRESEVRDAIGLARKTPPVFDIAIKPGKAGSGLVAIVTAKTNSVPDGSADIWGVYFNRYSKTSVGAGENGGHTLENINNVNAIKRLGEWRNNDNSLTVPIDLAPEDGFAVLVQSLHQGRILGAAIYNNQ